jgi:hypothetical protein
MHPGVVYIQPFKKKKSKSLNYVSRMSHKRPSAILVSHISTSNFWPVFRRVSRLGVSNNNQKLMSPFGTTLNSIEALIHPGSLSLSIHKLPLDTSTRCYCDFRGVTRASKINETIDHHPLHRAFCSQDLCVHD